MNFKLTKSSLNFKVYTSPTIPASGTENDIVIISLTPMENWILSSDSPAGEPRNNGDVWIQYSVSGNVFDIMNQHDFMLAITKIYQYISGTWVSVDARRYVGGVWDVVSSAFSATINITYPANSNCVVANSGGQTVASDTNTGTSAKTWTATVDATGTYTVTATATDGSGKTKSTTVSITADGQSKSVTLMYELILFDGGDNTSVTGGWTYTITKDDYYGGPSAREDNLTVGTTLYWLPGRRWNSEGTDQKNKNGYAHTKNKIDVTNYNTITAVSNYAQGHLTVGNASVALKVGTVSLDISALTGSYEVRLGDTASGDACSEVEISKLYLS